IHVLVFPGLCFFTGDEDEVPQFEDASDSDGGSVEEEGSDGGGSDGDEEKEEEGEEAGEEGNADSGWADAMAKILGKKTEQNKSSILVKNKELDKIKEKERQEQLERKKQVEKKHAWETMCREKPNVVNDREREKALQRIATRGVVQLFNAVKKHQKTMDDKLKEVGGSERKKAKILTSVSKKDFIDVLRGEEGGAEEKPAWSVLRDDFMMGATMKDWDKESGGEEQEA
uniref:RRP15-like protein n=1 Tax=Salarias fasciatus TaxID=181472 RepID=A0A672FTU7_SALFA